MKSKTYSAFFIVIALLLIFIIIPKVFNNDYYLHLMILSGLFILLTASYNLSWGFTGVNVLCIPTFFALGAYISGLLVLKLEISFLTAALTALIITGISGLFIGYLTLRFRGPYFVIVTLVFNYVIRIIVSNLREITGGPIGTPNIPRPELFISNSLIIRISSNIEYYYFVAIVVSLLMFFFNSLVHSRVGRTFKSIRENEPFSETVGVNTLKYKLLALLICSLFAGFAGILYAHYITVVSPDLFLNYYQISPMAMTMIGGRGTFYGPIVSAVLLTILPEYLRITQLLREFFYGSFIVIFVILKPEGLDIKSMLIKIGGIVRKNENSSK